MPTDLVTPIVSFASGVGVSIFAALISYQVSKRNDRRQRREQAAFEVYMLLLDLNSHYFWIASNELHGEPTSPETVAKVRGLAWRIADKLREADDVQHLEEVLTVLMSEKAHKTAKDRADAVAAVLDRFGDSVNPRYSEVIRRISEDNVRAFGSRAPDHHNNAPGLTGC